MGKSDKNWLTWRHREPKIPSADDRKPLVQTPLQPSHPSGGTALVGRVFGHPIVDFSASYTVHRSLGQGTFGFVNIVKDKFLHRFACKTIHHDCSMLPQGIRREVEVMHHLDGHPSIINLHEVIEDEMSVHIIMEHCRGGELFDRMVSKKRSILKLPFKKDPLFKKRYAYKYPKKKLTIFGKIYERKPFTENDAREIFRHIASVVHYCHDMGVMLRDVKPENFMFLTKKGYLSMKAIDFGFSTFFKPEEVFHDTVGSPPYIAPEVMNKRPYGPKADVWSAGVILYALLSGNLPFWTDDPHDIPRAIRESDYRNYDTIAWRRISDPAKQLVSRMMQENPEQRISAAEIMAHPWLGQVDGAAILEVTIMRRMKQFQAMCKFKRVALKVIAQTVLMEEETMGLRNIFESMKAVDQHNEEINITEDDVTFEAMKNGLTKWGVDILAYEMDLLLDTVDVDGNGVIHQTEFIAATMHKNIIKRNERKDYLQEAFKNFDRDNKGYMTLEDLQLALQECNMANRKRIEIIAQVFTEMSRRFYFTDFMTMMEGSN